MKIVCISDTHNLHRAMLIPDGDVLIHAGDITVAGDAREVADFNTWLGTLPHKHKVVVAGNHDFCFEKSPKKNTSIIDKCTLPSRLRCRNWRVVFLGFACFTRLPRLGI